MLKKMVLYNFLSFAEETEFSFAPTKYGILSQTNVSSTDVLKGGLFIGPNASGKSNAIKAIGFLLGLFKDQKTHFIQYKCVWTNKPFFEVAYYFDILGEEVEYRIKYYIGNRSLEESLSVDNKQVLSRLGNSGKLEIDGREIINTKLDDGTIFLRTAAFSTGNFPDNPVLNKLMEFIENSVFITSDASSRYAAAFIAEYAESNGLEKVNQFMKDFHYDFSIEYTNECAGEGVRFQSPDKKMVIFRRNSFPVPLLQMLESQGNLTFASIAPHIVNAIEHSCMVVIDEFGNSLHNKLAESIIHYFMEKTDQSQIFITSHCTNLVSNSVFRPDQINLITFDGKNGSHTKRLSDFKPREAQNLEKMYLGGMFEGLPSYE